MRCLPPSAAEPPTILEKLAALDLPPTAALVLVSALLLLCLLVWFTCRKRRPGLARSIFRLLVCRGRRLPGHLTGIVFPIHAAELTPQRVTTMLQHGGYLGKGSAVVAVRDRLTRIRDGVKGDKAIIDVEYGYLGTGPPPTDLPTTFFVKFSIQKLSAMRLLCETSEVSACEALFYTHLAPESRAIVPTPRCFFVDYNEVSGEFVLMSELLPFGEAPILPLKHRIRDAPTLAEQKRFAIDGGALNAAFWGRSALDRGCLRFDATHERAWTIMQGLSFLGLHHTTRRTLKGRPIPNRGGYVTWMPPAELIGLEGALIRDMPAILTSLCEEVDMTAFGHNDIVTDNAYFLAGADGAVGPPSSLSSSSFGLFDWQQSSVNSVGQEWAWNWHWLPPNFLTEHEDELIDVLLATYAAKGVHVARADFLRHYVLGCAQMYCFGGGGLQALMGRLNARGLLEDFEPDDARTRDGSVTDGALLELIVGAEMTRRTFTNCCNIMRRHGFATEWARWREANGFTPLSVSPSQPRAPPASTPQNLAMPMDATSSAAAAKEQTIAANTPRLQVVYSRRR